MKYSWGEMIQAAILEELESRSVNAENPTGEKGKAAMMDSPLGPSRKGSPAIPFIEPGETRILADITGKGCIRHIWMTVTDQLSPQNRFVLRDLVLRMYWDGETYPSVECPLGDFFCCGFGRSYMVNALPVSVMPLRGFNAYFAMPFRTKARITIENQNQEAIPNFFYQIDYTLGDDLPENTAYFHARWKRSKLTELGKDHVILDGVHGRGKYVGTFLALSTLERYWWGEGEVKFYLDGDEAYPTLCSTGTEDYFGGAWSFAGQENGKTVEKTYSGPYLGYPFYSKEDVDIFSPYHNQDCPPMRGLYRFHIPDPIYFKREIKVTLQQIGSCHAGMFERQDDVSSVAYWYQTEPHVPFPLLAKRQDRWPR